MEPHPEGGAFRETYRSTVDAKTDLTRSACTAIYFLFRQGQATSWHAVQHDEIYHLYVGSPLELSLINSTGTLETLILGTDLTAGQRPQIVIPGQYWQSARSLGEFTLIGCTVSPGFDFQDFQMATPEELAMRFPRIANQLKSSKESNP